MGGGRGPCLSTPASKHGKIDGAKTVGLRRKEAYVPREKPDLEVPPNPGYESNDVRARPDAIDAATAAENFASTPDLLAPTKLESRTPAKFWYRVFKPFVGADVSSKLQTEIDKGEDVSITSMNDVFGDPAHGVRKVFSAVCDYVPADPDHVPAGTPPSRLTFLSVPESDPVSIPFVDGFRVVVRSATYRAMQGTVCAVGGRCGIATLAESAVDVLFVDHEDPAHKFIKLNTADTGAVGSQWPLKQLRLGYAMSHEVPGTDGEFPPPSDGTIDATWEGPRMSEGAMYCRLPGSRHCLLSDGWLYHCCGNGGGLHLADGSASGWNWPGYNPGDPIECWLGFRSEAQCKKAVESVITMDLNSLDRLDRLSAKEGLEIVRTGEIDAQLATLVDTKPLITEMDIEPGNKPPGVTKAVLYRDKDTKRLTINYGVAGVRRKAGMSGCSHFKLGDPATKTINGKIWTRIWHYDFGSDGGPATGVWDMAAQDIAAFVKETGPTQVHIESGEDEYVTSKPGTGQWLIDNLRNGLALSFPPSNLSPDGKIEGELLDKTWEGPKKDAMRVPVKSPMCNSYSCLYHANCNHHGLALWPGLRGCNWKWNPDEVKEGKQIEVWLDAAIPQSGLKGTSLGQEVTPDDMFCWGSNSKSLGATVAAIVISEGLLSWQSTIASVFADDKDIMEKMDEWYKFITVEMFLSMTHGCNCPGTSMCYLPDDSKVKDDKAYMECSRAYVLEYCQRKPNMEKFGKYSYTSSGCAIVGGMIAKVCGKPWARVVKEKLWDKLLVDRGDTERKALFRYTPFADRNSATEFPFDRLRGPGDCEKYARVKGATNAGPEGVVWGHHGKECGHLNGEKGVGFAGPEPGVAQARPDVFHPLCGSYMATSVVFAHFCAWHASWAYANATTGVRKADYERMHNPMRGRCNGLDVDSGHYGMCVAAGRHTGHMGSTGNMQSHFHVFPDCGYSCITGRSHGGDTDSGTGCCFLNNGGKWDDHPDSKQVVEKRHVSPREFYAARVKAKR